MAAVGREDVTRRSTGLELRRAAAAFVGVGADAVRLRLGGVAVGDGVTVEALGLFWRTRELAVEVAPTGRSSGTLL